MGKIILNSETDRSYKMAGIQDLPVELLTSIFAFSYADHREEKTARWSYISSDDEDEEIKPQIREKPKIQTVWSDHDLSVLSLFPCAFARVCQLWLNVMARNSLYWTRFAFDLSAEEPLLYDAFLWSKDLHFDMLVFDSRISCATDSQRSDAPARERARVESITTKLIPHLSRCKSLVFDVAYSSSLPMLPSLLSSTMAELRLDYRTHLSDSIGRNPWPSRTASESSVNFTSLTYLSLDVETFMRMARLYPQWSANLVTEYRFGLEVCKYAFEDSEESENSQICGKREFFEALCEFRRMSTLTLSHLSLRNGAVQQPQRTRRIPTTLYLHRPDMFVANNLSEDFLDAFFRECSLSAESVTFDGCILPSNICTDSAWFLSLKNLPQIARPERALVAWGGGELLVDSCPSFDDSVIRSFSDAIRPDNGFSRYFVLHSLHFEDCLNFSFESIKELVQVLEQSAPDNDPNVLSSLSLSGQWPPLSQADLRWFRSHVTFVHVPVN